MALKTEEKSAAPRKLADPLEATIDVASQQMIQRSHDLNIETAFDRAVTMKPCNIGTQGICCNPSSVATNSMARPRAMCQWMPEGGPVVMSLPPVLTRS